MESERLRNSLLSALSHDLRTPLTALVGLADSLALAKPAADRAAARAGAGDPRRGAAHERAGQQPARHGAPAERATSSSTGSGSRSRKWSAARCAPARSLLAAARRCRSSLPTDLPLVQFDAVLIERVLVQPAGERGQVHAGRHRASASAAQAERPIWRSSCRRQRPRPAAGPAKKRSSRSSRAASSEVGRRRASASGWRSAAPSSRRTAARSAAERGAGRRRRASSSPCRSARRRAMPTLEPSDARRSRTHMSEPHPIVVLVEDEPQIRRFVRTALEAEGCHVFEAETVRARPDRGRHAQARPGRARSRPAGRRRRRLHPRPARLVGRADHRAVGARRRSATRSPRSTPAPTTT